MGAEMTATGATIEDTNPATEELLATVSCVDAAGVAAAVLAAQSAQHAWSAIGFEARATVLERIASAFEQSATQQRLAELVTAEMGKPLADARKEAAACARGIRNLTRSCRDALAPVETTENGLTTLITREPLGVVAAITPWNFPLGMAREVIVPALLAGNTVVFKPSELVPLCGAALAQIFAAELPADVLVLVQGKDTTGKALVASDIDMVGFVGSVEAGRHIMAACGAGLKRLVLELGGKDPMIVCADADLEAAADFAVRESMRNTGQVCCAVERIYVEQSVAERFADLVVERAGALATGDGREDVFMGPLASRRQRDHVLAQVQDAADRGANVRLGGEPLDRKGWFMAPTVVTDVDESMQLMTEETFGPVASISSVGSAEEAVTRANASPFGLGASVWTGDLAHGRNLASAIQAGQVGVNRGLGGAGDPPWAGVKQSGFGFLGSPDGYRQFTRPLSVSWNEPA